MSPRVSQHLATRSSCLGYASSVSLSCRVCVPWNATEYTLVFGDSYMTDGYNHAPVQYVNMSLPPGMPKSRDNHLS
ncbi:hypothetical protein OG21DRAFT_1517736 [Imleria badia]|nr:hypothetical protein OG21DRAFT_1517736 [Imleria badia]